MKKHTKWVALLLVTVLLAGCGSAGVEDYNNGVKSMKSGNYEKANEYFKAAIDKNDSQPEYYVSNGMVLLQLKKYEEAMKNFEKAKTDGSSEEANEMNKRAYRGIGMSYYYQRDYAKAKENLEKSLSYSELPELNKDTYMYLGTTYSAADENDKAIDAYTKVLESDAKSIMALCGKYKALQNLKRTDDAKDVMKQALACSPSTMEEKFAYAKMQCYNGDYESAEEDLNGAAEDGYTEAYLFLGQVNISRNKYKDAIKNFKSYMEATGTEDDLTLCNEMAICYIESYDYKNAKKWVDKGVKQSAEDTELQSIRYNQVLVYDKLGEYEKAYSLVKEYLEVYPDDKNLKEEEAFLKGKTK